MIKIVVLQCNFGFPGFIDSTVKYRVARLDDHDSCAPNGYLKIEWGINPCGPVVTESTEDYSAIYPIGSVFPGTASLKYDHVTSDTFTYFISACPFHANQEIRISWTLSDKI